MTCFTKPNKQEKIHHFPATYSKITQIKKVAVSKVNENCVRKLKKSIFYFILKTSVNTSMIIYQSVIYNFADNLQDTGMLEPEFAQNGLL